MVCASLACFGQAVNGGPAWGRPVVAIRLECDADLKAEDFAGEIVQKTGEPLDPTKVELSIKNLYATGRFQELRADTETRGAGVELIFVASAQFYVGLVRVAGAPASFNAESLAGASRLRLGQPLTEDELTRGEQRLAATLGEDGYHDARITRQVQRDTKSQEADVLFAIVPGRPAVLGAIEFVGHPAVPPRRLTAVAGWRVGRRLTSDRLERGLFRIHQYYMKRNHLQAFADIQKRNYDPARYSEKLVVQAEAGPVVKVRVKGAAVSLAKRRELLPMYSEGVVDEVAIQQGARNLEDHFERLGYFSAHVMGERKASPDSSEIDINYTVTLGPAGEFQGFAFVGNRRVPAEELAKSLSIQARDFPFTWRGTFSQVLLDSDIKSLVAYYQSKGFLEARVKARLDDHFGDQPHHLFVTFEVDEGAQTRVGRLALEGVDPAMQRSITALLATKPGQPYSPSRAQADRDSILSYLADRGYSHATASWKASQPSPSHEVDLEYDLVTGAQEKIRRVILMGNEHTRAGIIRRELAFRQGEPLSQSKVLESQRRLYNLGVFTQVQIAPQAPESPEADKPLLVKVQEGQRWTVGYGGGIEAQRLGSNQPQGQFRASPRALLEVTRIDVGGRDQTFSIRGQLSDLEKTAAVGYLIPRLPARPDLGLRLGGLFDQSHDVATFSAERDEASVSIEKHFGPATLLVGRYAFRHVLAGSLHVAPDQIPLVSQPARVAMVGASYISDRRDNPADATRGTYWLADAGIAVQSLGSQANFLRFSGQNSTYYAFGRHLVFARNTRIGIESPYGGLRRVVIPGSPPQIIYTHDIPLPERFFMGGSESHRGFSINQAGPRDPVTGYPVGGNALFLNTLELRIRIQEDRLGFVLFQDAGNVYTSGRTMRLLKVSQNSPTDLDYTSHALGAGVRYKTPVGPLRFDLGYNLNPPRYQLQLPGGLGVRQLSNLQFSIGIGQSF